MSIDGLEKWPRSECPYCDKQGNGNNGDECLQCYPNDEEDTPGPGHCNGRHTQDCRFPYDYDKEAGHQNCTCGLDQAIAKAKGVKNESL